MSLSQKFSGFCIVPWYNSAEWKRVYQLIFGENATADDQREGLKMLKLWKVRMSLLPSGIEGTMYILEAMLVDSSVLSEHQVCIHYCSNVMRFLNICVANRAQVFNFTKTAKSYSIPDWIINIRHDFAHSPKVPSFSTLKLALDECFKWLKDTYWDPELLVIKDYIIEKEIDTDDGLDVVKLVSNLIIWLNSERPFPDDLAEEVLNFDFDYVDLENFPEVMNELFKNIGDKNDHQKWRNLITELIFRGLFDIHPKTQNESKDSYTFKYTAKLIDLIHVNKNLINLVNELQKLMNDENEPETRRLPISRWLNEIFIGILKSKRSNQNVDYSDLHGTGVTFKHVPKVIQNEIIGMRDQMFENLNEVNRKCFQSFMLLSSAENIKECNDYFNQLKNTSGKTGWQNLGECSDFVDCSKSSDVCVPKSLNDTYEKESNNKTTINSNVEKPRKRWTLVKDVNFESCALGVDLYSIESPMEIC